MAQPPTDGLGDVGGAPAPPSIPASHQEADVTYHTAEWHAARIASLSQTRMTWDEWRKAQKEQQAKEDALVGSDKAMRAFLSRSGVTGGALADMRAGEAKPLAMDRTGAFVSTRAQSWVACALTTSRRNHAPNNAPKTTQASTERCWMQSEQRG